MATRRSAGGILVWRTTPSTGSGSLSEGTPDTVVAVTATLPTRDAGHAPVVLVHGAANSAAVWSFWQEALGAHGWSSYAVDLRGHGQSGQMNLSQTSMADYVLDVRSLVAELARRPVLMGWSMGGLVAMMAAANGTAAACVGLAPSRPAESVDTSLTPRSGEFGPEEYGITSRNPEDQPAMPDLDSEERSIALESLCRESPYARDERKAGVVVETLPCPLLIVTGTADTQWPLGRYEGLSLPAEYASVEGASHWGLVLNRRALTQGVSTVLDRLAEALNR